MALNPNRPRWRGVNHLALVTDDMDATTRFYAGVLGAVKEIFAGVNVPMYVVPGNHDYARGDIRKAYDELFPERLNYAFDHKGWQFVALDTTEGTKYQNTTISDTTLKWLDGQLPKLDKKKPLVVFTHFPLGEGVRMRPKNADAVLKRLTDYNLRAAYNGHFHAFTEKKAGDAVLTTNKCCAFSKGNHDGTTRGFVAADDPRLS